MEYLKKHKLVAYLLGGVVGLLAVLLVAWQIAMSNAADIFNAAMERQNIFKGKIAADSMHCDFYGYINFVNLNWTTDKGETIVKMPKGYVKINPLDLINTKVGPDAIKEVYIEDAAIRLRFNDQMKLDILQEKTAAKASSGEQQPKAKPDDKHDNVPEHTNLNLPKKMPNWRFVLKNCSVAADIKNRSYVLDKVDCSLAITEHRYADLDFVGSDLGGTLKGEGLTLKGRADLIDDSGIFKLNLNNIVPESIGLGKLSDPVNLNADITGTLLEPVATGKISFKKLDLGNNLVFTNVSSDFQSTKGLMKFTNTKGNIWGGSVDATGLYNLKTRRYRIDALGHAINLSQATKISDAEGEGQLTFTLLCDPQRKRQAIAGTFDIAKGKFKHFGFNRLTGEVFSYNNETYIKNIKLYTKLINLTKKAIKVSKGKVELKPELLDEAAIMNELSKI